MISIGDDREQIISSLERELTDNEIAYYINEYRPFDKAGAYAIQEWIGYIGITGIEGSFYTIMGLPIHLVYRELESL